MAQRNDDELAFYLVAAVKASGQISDENRDWLLSQLAPYTGATHINDLWQAFWVAEGIAPGHVNDMAYAWLILQGISPGHINDMWGKFMAQCILATGQLTDRTPVGRTSQDDGALQLGLPLSYNILTTGQYSGTTNITVNLKTDTHSNECVKDNNTGLMWTRAEARNIGPNSDGLLHWDDTAGSNEDVFEYCDQANLAVLSGYNDWRVPNIKEIHSLSEHQLPAPFIYDPAFPGINNNYYWSSTSYDTNPTQAYAYHTVTGEIRLGAKTTATRAILLVR